MSSPKGLVNVALILFIWSLLTYFVRVWVKRRAWAPDDTAVSVSLLFLLTHVILVLEASAEGFPQPWSELDEHAKDHAYRILYGAQMMYILALGTVRLSSSIFNARLTLDPSNKVIATCITVSCGTWIFASLLAVALRGDLTQPWRTLNGSYSLYMRWMGVEITGALLELTMWAMSVYFIARLNMPVSKKTYLSAIFACRLIVIPFTVMRLIYLSPSRNTDPNLPATTASIYAELAVNVAMISASITCLKPFLRPFDSKYTQTAGRNNFSGGIKNSRGDTYYMLSATRSFADNERTAIDSRISDRGTQQSISGAAPAFRPGGPRNRTFVESGQNPKNDQNVVDPNKLTISLTKQWDVQYEESIKSPRSTTAKVNSNEMT